MSHWSDGYVADVSYLHGYQPELNPLRLPLAFLNAGLAPPSAGMSCELGFGQGVSTNLHAAATVSEWYGTDFSPPQAAYARRLAEVSHAKAHFFDQSFADFCGREDLPDFDFICMHGIWSWINDDNRRTIVDFIRRKLKSGGAIYVSYNALPGLAGFAPLQDLLMRSVDLYNRDGADLTAGIDGALALAERVVELSPMLAQGSARAVERLKNIRRENRAYVAHEYFNRNWNPTSFGRMGEWLGGAGLEYACSANHFSSIDALNLTPPQQDFLKEIPDALVRETARDLLMNQTFRKDYWVKDGRRLSADEKSAALARERVVLMRAPALVSRKIGGALGDRALLDRVCDPIIQALADYRPKTLAQLESAVKPKGVEFAQLVEVVQALVKNGGVASAQNDADIGSARPQTDKLNLHLCAQACQASDVSFLASPVTVTAIELGRIPQLFLNALHQGKQQPGEIAAHAWRIMQSQGITVLKNGKPLSTPAEGLDALTEEVFNFVRQHLPVLTSLQVI